MEGETPQKRSVFTFGKGERRAPSHVLFIFDALRGIYKRIYEMRKKKDRFTRYLCMWIIPRVNNFGLICKWGIFQASLSFPFILRFLSLYFFSRTISSLFSLFFLSYFLLFPVSVSFFSFSLHQSLFSFTFSLSLSLSLWSASFTISIFIL